jgi:hypothetical protein
MARHRAPRYVRTKKVLTGVPVAAGATVVGLGVLTSPAHAATTHDWNGSSSVIGSSPDQVTPGQVLVTSGAAQASPAASPAVAASHSVTKAAAAHIINRAGPVRPQAQRAANAIVAGVPGADDITIYGTRASAVDKKGHPSGLALDYMVGSDAALGFQIVTFHHAYWNELGVDYIIWEQKILTSPTGQWRQMKDRGSATANHMDHVHVNYRP